MTKEELLKHCSGYENSYHLREIYFKNHLNDIYLEIQRLNYPENFTFQQKLYHYIHNDYELQIGVCPTCGKRTRFITFGKGYEKYCSIKCSCNEERVIKRKKTCFEKYGDENYNNMKKHIETCINTYGVSNVSKSNEIKTKKLKTRKHNEELGKTCFKQKVQKTWCKKDKKEHVDKIKKGKFLKYGDENYNNVKKIKKSWELKTEDEKKKILNKIEETKQKLYGDKNYNNIELIKRTNNKKYGCNTPLQNEMVKRVINEIKNKKYGNKNYNNRKKANETFIKRYGNVKYRNHEQSVKTRKENRISNNEYLLGYTDNGEWICKCENNECKNCVEKTYTISPVMYCDRKRRGYETCTKLNPIGYASSGCENLLYEYIKTLYFGEILKNDRKLLGGKELDIYLPEKRLAFEFNGVYWHSEINVNENYHYNKSISCLNKGVQLIHIWEDDWLNKQDILKNLIRGKLGLHTNKLNARDCTVKEIDSKTAKKFCDTYHIQGYTPSQVKLGLYKDSQLVMVCLFTHKRRLIGGKPKDGEWELSRVCSPFDTHVRGGASKLLKHFIRLYDPKSIVTFADLSVSNGEVYEKMGFKKEYIVPPTYYWVVDGVRLPRYRFQKSNLQECKEHPELTEREVMESRGSFRCWDAGKIKYVYTPDL